MDDREPRAVSRRERPVWRWSFLCAKTALLTLLAVAVFQWDRGNVYLDEYSHPICAGIFMGVLTLTTLFLLVASPFFFQRLGALAVAYWITALAALIWSCLPTF